MSDTPILSIEHATKSFGAVLALNDVSLELHEREILAIVGDNGAGKSTLINCLSGLHHLDSGQIYLAGSPVTFRHPTEAKEAGIETVYQDLALFDNLNPHANFFIGREKTWPKWAGPLGFLRANAMEREWQESRNSLRIGIPNKKQLVGLMSGGQRQAIAVARSVAFATRVVVLDEPTAALGVKESAEVLRLISSLPEIGVSVILISHNMQHVTQVADRAVALRLGRNVGEVRTVEGTQEKLVSLIVGASELTKPDETSS